MTKKQAEDRGYVFAAYDFHKDKIKEVQQKIRNAGFRAVLVIVPSSPLSRGPYTRGYSVYTEPGVTFVYGQGWIKKELSALDKAIAKAKERDNADIITRIS